MDQTTSPARRRMRWAAVSLVGALSLVGAACGDDDDGGDEAAGGGEDFCQTMQELEDREFEGEEPTEEEIAAVFDEMEDLDPPAEIEESWNRMMDATRRAFADPASAPDLTDEIDQASQEVEAYLREDCGIE
jgi:hypothetical protein